MINNTFRDSGTQPTTIHHFSQWAQLEFRDLSAIFTSRLRKVEQLPPGCRNVKSRRCTNEIIPTNKTTDACESAQFAIIKPQCLLHTRHLAAFYSLLDGRIFLRRIDIVRFCRRSIEMQRRTDGFIIRNDRAPQILA